MVKEETMSKGRGRSGPGRGRGKGTLKCSVNQSCKRADKYEPNLEKGFYASQVRISSQTFCQS